MHYCVNSVHSVIFKNKYTLNVKKRENEKREKIFENNYRNLLLDILNCVNKIEKKKDLFYFIFALFYLWFKFF